MRVEDNDFILPWRLVYFSNFYGVAIHRGRLDKGPSAAPATGGEISLSQVLTSLTPFVLVSLPGLHVLLKCRTLLLQTVNCRILLLQRSLQISYEVLLNLLQLVQSILMRHFLNTMFCFLVLVDPLDGFEVGVVVILGLVLGFFLKLIHVRRIHLLVG